MLNYIARVELEGGATSKEYDDLHDAMEKEGFLRTISDNKTDFHLPTGTYIWATTQDVSTSQLRTKLKAVISAVHNNFLLIVAKADFDNVNWWLTKV